MFGLGDRTSQPLERRNDCVDDAGVLIPLERGAKRFDPGGKTKTTERLGSTPARVGFGI